MNSSPFESSANDAMFAPDWKTSVSLKSIVVWVALGLLVLFVAGVVLLGVLS